MDEILVLGEINEGEIDLRTLELLGAGKMLSSETGKGLSIVIVGDSVKNIAEQLTSYGVDKVYTIEHPILKGFIPELWLEALTQACKKINPSVVLMSHGFIGMDIGPRLAHRLDTVITNDCIELSVDKDDGMLIRKKPVYGGNAIAVFKCPGRPQMATLRAKVFEPIAQMETSAEVIPFVPEINESMVQVESMEVVKEEVISLDKADVVVSGGAGLGDEDGFELLQELVEALSPIFGKVMIGCSRVAVDKGWISSDHQVGLTGSMISPDIYIAVGISGAIQHLVGMIHSKKIIAINTDPNCNMFKVADYGVVEDYEKVIPQLVKRLEEIS